MELRPTFNPEEQPEGALRLTFENLPIANRGVYDVAVDIAELYGTYECVGLAVKAHDGRRVDGGVLRCLRVADLTRAAAVCLEESGLAEAFANAMVPPRLLAPPLPYVDRRTGKLVEPPMSPAEHEVAMAYREKDYVAPARAKADRYRRMVREAARAGGFTRLEAAAEIYKQAVKVGRSPTRAVQQDLGITYDAAVGLVRRCRAQTPPLIPKTTKRTVSKKGKTS